MNPDIHAYSCLIQASIHFGLFLYAFERLEEMSDETQPANRITYDSLFNDLCKTYKLDAAFALCKEFRDKGSDPVEPELIEAYRHPPTYGKLKNEHEDWLVKVLPELYLKCKTR